MERAGLSVFSSSLHRDLAANQLLIWHWRAGRPLTGRTGQLVGRIFLGKGARAGVGFRV